ncbi:hypothetical protein [Kitasatospora sp. MBT66]|uniref:hypothetical protein n=1 Tax=Kitasatospora sp. MBT66 TaxID=1444769 RepID=UPI0005B95F4D|nr:hypothetical protein [Kitasatospora sp. MBT66]
MTRTLTGRRQAATVARITGAASTWAWVDEASGLERTRRATVRRIARLTGTEPIRWDGEIGDENWTAVLSAGADALLAHAADEEQAFGMDLVAAAEQIIAEADAATDAELETTTVLPADTEPVPGRNITRVSANPDRTGAEQAAVDTWSPFSPARRADARWSETRRAVSGPRRPADD